jgi:hypothetical protein
MSSRPKGSGDNEELLCVDGKMKILTRIADLRHAGMRKAFPDQSAIGLFGLVSVFPCTAAKIS